LTFAKEHGDPRSGTLAKQRGSLEHLFVLISFGDVLGVPILPPYYSLRERDLMDAIF
jgi:hypothetical protein